MILLLLLASLIFLPSLSSADNSTLSGYFEAGRKSQSEDFEEEEEDREYTYHNYHLRFRNEASDRATHELSSFIYDKDYRSEDRLDNVSKILNTGGSYYINKIKNEYLRLDIKLKYREKRYRESPSSEYDQIMFSPGLIYNRKDYYSINLSAGVNNYDYLFSENNDQLKFFSRIRAKKYFLEKKLQVVTSYKIETAAHRRVDKRKNKNDFMLGADYVFDSTLIYKAFAEMQAGQRDTKDDDERDEDFDYKYRQFKAETEHKIAEKVKTDISYQYFRKDYLSAEFDHSGFHIGNVWRCKIIDDEMQKLSLNFTAAHKDVDYVLKSGSGYRKETIGIESVYARKKNWEAVVSVQGNFYKYDDLSRDKNRYYTVLSLEKHFPEKAISISAKVKYKYTDNKYANNTREESARLAFEYKF